MSVQFQDKQGEDPQSRMSMMKSALKPMVASTLVSAQLPLVADDQDETLTEILNKIQINEKKAMLWYNFMQKQQVDVIRDYLEKNNKDFLEKKKELTEKRQALHEMRNNFEDQTYQADYQINIISERQEQARYQAYEYDQKISEKTRLLQEADFQINLCKMLLADAGSKLAFPEPMTKATTLMFEHNMTLITQLFYMVYDHDLVDENKDKGDKIKELIWSDFKKTAINDKIALPQLLDTEWRKLASDRNEDNLVFRVTQFFNMFNKQIKDSKSIIQEAKTAEVKPQPEQQIQLQDQNAVQQNKEAAKVPTEDIRIKMTQFNFSVLSSDKISRILKLIGGQDQKQQIEDGSVNEIENINEDDVTNKAKDAFSKIKKDLNQAPDLGKPEIRNQMDAEKAFDDMSILILKWMQYLLLGNRIFKQREVAESEKKQIEHQKRANINQTMQDQDDILLRHWEQNKYYNQQMTSTCRTLIQELETSIRSMDDGIEFIANNLQKFQNMLNEIKDQLVVPPEFYNEQPQSQILANNNKK